MGNTPRVGLTVTRGRDRDHPKNRFYIACLEEAGAEVVVLHSGMKRDWEQMARLLQGLVLGGGGDVHPRRYGMSLNGTYRHSIDEERDALEFYLVRAFLARDLPILGICRGIQVLNVAFGGGLCQHIPGHAHRNGGNLLVHEVRVRPESRLWAALGRVERLPVNSHHHQAITPDMLAPALLPTAWAMPDQNVIEGIESINHHWVVGVQWHPERVHEFPAASQEAQRRLFQSFVRVTRERSIRV